MSICPADMCFTFALDEEAHAGKKRKRASFKEGRRQEVASIRAQGACMRCRMLKISCSKGRPCDACMKASLSQRPSKLRWMQCVTTSLLDVNIFAVSQDGAEPYQGSLYSCADSLFRRLDQIVLDFDTNISWSIEDLTENFTRWLLSEDGEAQTSRTGILSSPEFVNSLASYLDRGVCRMASLLVWMTSVLYDQGCDYDELHRDIALVRAHAATLVLEELESMLRPSVLETLRSSKARLQSLFLLVLGVIMAVSYCSIGHQPRKPEDLPIKSSIRNVHRHLLRTLSHHLVTIMNALGLLKCDEYGATLGEMDACRLHRPTSFQWDFDSIRYNEHQYEEISTNLRRHSGSLDERLSLFRARTSIGSTSDSDPCKNDPMTEDYNIEAHLPYIYTQSKTCVASDTPKPDVHGSTYAHVRSQPNKIDIRGSRTLHESTWTEVLQCGHTKVHKEWIDPQIERPKKKTTKRGSFRCTIADPPPASGNSCCTCANVCTCQEAGGFAAGYKRSNPTARRDNTIRTKSTGKDRRMTREELKPKRKRLMDFSHYMREITICCNCNAAIRGRQPELYHVCDMCTTRRTGSLA